MPAISDGLTRFTIQTAGGETDLALDIVEASQAFNGISRQCADEKLTNFEYVDRFAEWVSQETGVKLRKAQALEVLRAIDETLRPKARGEDGGSSPSSTAPAP